MQLKIFNTLTREKETFSPINKKEVGLYGCGPTVYNYAHIGNLRTYTFIDLLKRVLIFNDYKVKHVMNITDVGHLVSDADDGEDKMLKGAKREKKTVWEVAAFYTQAVITDMERLNLISPNVLCKATDHIKEQLDLIEKLEKNGYTYVAGGNVYFDTSKLKDYGKLARLDVNAEQKSRVEKDSNKKNSNDFVLWFTKSKFQDQEMKWPSKYGIGYPGWHVECSAMSSKYLGKQFDIHCGATDLIPVHHTNEIAQSEAAFGIKPWVKYWMHGEFLVVGKNEKMSKSSGEFLTLQVLIDKGYDPLAYRYLCLTAHYRKPLNFSYEALDSAQISLNKLRSKVQELLMSKKEGGSAEEYIEEFQGAINDDLNMPQALAVVWNLLKDEKVEDSEKYDAIINFDRVFGLKLGEIKSVDIPEEIKILVEEREQMRKVKNWKESDRLRQLILDKGYVVLDSANGPVITKSI